MSFQRATLKSSRYALKPGIRGIHSHTDSFPNIANPSEGKCSTSNHLRALSTSSNAASSASHPCIGTKTAHRSSSLSSIREHLSAGFLRLGRTFSSIQAFPPELGCITRTMDLTTQAYPPPSGCYGIPAELLDLRPDSEIDQFILNPPPVTNSEKNVWFYWSTGYSTAHEFTKRTIRSWYRRFSKQGWTIRVLDRAPGSCSNVDNFLDTRDSEIFPQAFVNGNIGGEFGAQYTSDFVRFPLLIKYGGVYADVGVMQIGDLNRLWNETIGNPNSAFEVISYNMGGVNVRSLTNYFLCSGRNNELFERCHRLFLAVWNENGGRNSTEDNHMSPLLEHLPLRGEDSQLSLKQQRDLTDYHTHEQVITAVLGLIDDEDEWNGPKYSAEKIYAMDYMQYSQLVHKYTGGDGRRGFELMSLRLPKDGELESIDQKLARTIVESCLQKSFGFKLAHGMVVKLTGESLGSLWRTNDGSDIVPGTYAHWLRFGMAYWNQDELPPRLGFQVLAPTKVGTLLGSYEV